MGMKKLQNIWLTGQSQPFLAFFKDYFISRKFEPTFSGLSVHPLTVRSVTKLIDAFQKCVDEFEFADSARNEEVFILSNKP